MAVLASQVSAQSMDFSVPQPLEAVFNHDSLNKYSVSGDTLALGSYFSGRLKYKDVWSKLISDTKFTPAELGRVPTDPADEYLLFKQKVEKRAAINFFADTIAGLINPNCKLLVIGVPSSDAENVTHGTRLIADRVAALSLAASTNLECANECLIRVKTQQAAHLGGSRSLEQNLETLATQRGYKLVGQTIILIDDVTTTGNAMEAAKQLLLAAGAAKVVCIALGKTARHLADITAETVHEMRRVKCAIQSKIVKPFADKYDTEKKKVIRYNITQMLEENLKLFLTCYNEVQKQKALALEQQRIKLEQQKINEEIRLAEKIQAELRREQAREAALKAKLVKPKPAGRKRKPLQQPANQPTILVCFAQIKGRLPLLELVNQDRKEIVDLTKDDQPAAKPEVKRVKFTAPSNGSNIASGLSARL